MSDRPMAPMTVACSGHWLIEHDTIGPRVAELIAGRYPVDEVEVADIGTAGLALVDVLRGQELVVVVDACLAGGEPGEISLREADFEAPLGRETSVHQLGPQAALQVAYHLYPERLPRRSLLLLVETGDTDEERREAACHEVVVRLDALAAQRRSEQEGLNG